MAEKFRESNAVAQALTFDALNSILNSARDHLCQLRFKVEDNKWISETRPFPHAPNAPDWNKRKIRYFERSPNGECLPPQCGVLDAELLKHGIKVREDHGLYFYFVQNKGETVSGIYDKLMPFSKFAYLKNVPKTGVSGGNIPILQVKMWIPLPQKIESRKLENEQFVNYCHEAIQELLRDPIYGERMKKILNEAGFKELFAVLLAVAKTECGKKPLGQFQFHRWENDIRAFSYSIFHVLMEKNRDGSDGPGLRARKKLNMSVGQTYHPKNAAKLFLAYLIEKSREFSPFGKKYFNSPEKFFPLSENFKEWSVFYNGENFDPNYRRKTEENYRESLEWFSGKGLNFESQRKAIAFQLKKMELCLEKPHKMQPVPMLLGSLKNIADVIVKSARAAGFQTGKFTLFSRQLPRLVEKMKSFIKRMYKGKVEAADEIEVSFDLDFQAKYKRNGRSDIVSAK